MICGTTPASNADFAAAINSAQQHFNTTSPPTPVLIDARQPGAFVSLVGSGFCGFGAVTPCVFSDSDISAGLPSTFKSNILFGEYVIITSVPWTTPSTPPTWIGMTSGSGATIVGTTLVACYLPQDLLHATCGPASFPQLPATAIRATAAAPFFTTPTSGGTVTVCTNSGSVPCVGSGGTTSAPVVVGSGTTFLSSMVGGYFTSCATSGNHGQTCPQASSANSAIIASFTSTSKITLATTSGTGGTYSGPTEVSGLAYAIYSPNIVPLLNWGGNSASNTSLRFVKL